MFSKYYLPGIEVRNVSNIGLASKLEMYCNNYKYSHDTSSPVMKHVAMKYLLFGYIPKKIGTKLRKLKAKRT